jgi:long-chain acyl-CoA synthetase
MRNNIAQYLLQHLPLQAGDGARVLYRYCSADNWRDVTARDVATLAARWQQAFRRAGCARGDRVAICARNGLHWIAVDQAAVGLGLVVVPLYVDDNADNIAWCARDAEARLLVIENARLATAMARAYADAASPCPPMVVLQADPDADAVAESADWTEVDRFLPEDAPAFEGSAVDAETLATICYTSGTSGRPKGVMLTHGNIISNVEQCRATRLALHDDCFLSILPLSHMFERTGGYYLPLAVGAKVTFGRGIAQIADDLKTQQPTAIFAVPRVFEKTYQRIEQTLEKSALKRRLFAACVEGGYRAATGRATLLDALLQPLLRKLVARPVLARMGGKLRLAVVGGAAFDPKLARAFIGLGLPVLQGYGMTEASPVVSVNRLDDNVPESVGRPLDGIEVKLGDFGELLVRGGNVMQGYWRNVEATRAVLLPDGWLRTGDVAELRDGHLYICGRVKDIIVMSNGEKLAPADAEMAIQRDSAFEQALLVGEGRPFPILLAVSRERDEKSLLKRANERLKTFPRWVRIRRVIICPEPWTVENGMLTPTLKTKRPKVLQRYQAEIDAAYAEGAGRDEA